MSKSRKKFFVYVFVFFALAIATYSLSYYWHNDNPFNSRYRALSVLGRYSHFIGAGCALLFGALQCFTHAGAFAHRVCGYAYCLSVAMGAAGGFYLAFHAYLGFSTGLGFFILDLLWVGTTGYAIYCIATGKAKAHGRWMLRSMALTSAAISLRILLPLLAIFLPFDTSYLMVAWLCWILNLIALETYWYFSRRPTPNTAGLQISTGSD